MNDNNKYSSYWIGGGLTNVDKSTDNSHIIELASYKRAISNFVNIVTGENIPVTFNSHGDSFTDGNRVTISAKMDEKDFDPSVGLALHEGSHIKLTDFSILNKYIGRGVFVEPITNEYIHSLSVKHGTTELDVINTISGIIKDLLNVIEDRRIDNYIYTTSPGYRGYYHAMYDKYFNSPIIDKGLKSSYARTNDWDSYMFRIINITNPNTDLSALPMLKLVSDMIDLNSISRLQTTMDAFKLSCEIFKIIEDSLPSQLKDNQPKKSDDTSSDESNDSTENNDSDENHNSDESNSSNGSGDDSDDSDDSNSSNGSGDDSDDSDDSNSSNGSGGESKQDSTDTDESKGDAKGTNVKDLSQDQINKLKKQIDKQKDFQNNKTSKKKLSKDDNSRVSAASEAGISEVMVGFDYKGNGVLSNKTPMLVIRNFSKNLIDSGLVTMINTSTEYAQAKLQPAIDEGIRIGTVLGKRLKLRSEERSLTTPRMKNGKISNRLLHELGMGNMDIFEHTVIDKYTPTIVHISIDASSSMNGDKWINAQTAAISIAKAASMTSNMDVVISYRATQGYNKKTFKPLILIAYDSRTDKFNKIQNLFKYIRPTGTTPEGLCFEAIMKELMNKTSNVDSYFINFSDGQPMFSNSTINYIGSYALEHTATQVNKMRKAGIKVLSYFISNFSTYGSEQFKYMYGKDSQTIDVKSVVQLSKTLNKLFE